MQCRLQNPCCRVGFALLPGFAKDSRCFASSLVVVQLNSLCIGNWYTFLSLHSALPAIVLLWLRLLGRTHVPSLVLALPVQG